MLNKEVCKRCISRIPAGWLRGDSQRWLRDYIAWWRCRGRDGRDTGHTSVTDEPPEWCPYIAEHVVSQKC